MGAILDIICMPNTNHPVCSDLSNKEQKGIKLHLKKYIDAEPSNGDENV
jgi:hypothetical protein